MKKVNIAAVISLFICMLLSGCGTSQDKAIWNAVRKGETEKVKALLLKNPNLVNTLYQEEYVIVKGTVTPKYDDREGDTVLFCALNNGHAGTAELLITKGANVNVKNCYKETPLHKASLKGLSGITELLISKGADINAKNGSNQSPLFYAVDNGHKDIVELLISKGADLNIEDNDRETPLTQAIKKDFVEITDCLLKRGATLNKSGTTLLHIASHYGSLKTTEYLLTKGAPVNGRDKNKDTPLHLSHGGVTVLLIEKGADVNAKGKDNDTPLLRAALAHEPREVWLLISKGANVNALNASRNTPLHYSSDGCAKSVKHLIDSHADVTMQNMYGLTPLHKSSIMGYQDIADMLLSNGANINARDKNNKTPLDYALETAGDTNRPEDIRERCRKYAEYLRGKGAI